jgi:hypothetical protein
MIGRVQFSMYFDISVTLGFAVTLIAIGTFAFKKIRLHLSGKIH